MPITFEDAFAQTNPNKTNPNMSDEDWRKAREESALRIMQGVAANDAYWDSRTQLEQYVARAEGHGVVQRGADEPPPTAVGTPTAAPQVVEGTATEEPETGAGPEPNASAEDQLRAQLRAAGIAPTA